MVIVQIVYNQFYPVWARKYSEGIEIIVFVFFFLSRVDTYRVIWRYRTADKLGQGYRVGGGGSGGQLAGY